MPCFHQDPGRYKALTLKQLQADYYMEVLPQHANLRLNKSWYKSRSRSSFFDVFIEPSVKGKTGLIFLNFICSNGACSNVFTAVLIAIKICFAALIHVQFPLDVGVCVSQFEHILTDYTQMCIRLTECSSWSIV